MILKKIDKKSNEIIKKNDELKNMKYETKDNGEKGKNDVNI